MESFWKGRTVLVTGSSGFVGSYLTKTLLKKGADVVGISGKGENFRQEFEGDVTDYQFLEKIFNKFKIDTCFHLAAHSLVEGGLGNPLATFSVNIKGTWNILEVCRRSNIRKIIIASTAHVYGDNKKLPYKENYCLMPTRPYETSKVCADFIAQTYANTYELPVEIPRFVNIYGPGDLNFSRIIPRTIKTVLENKNVKIWGGESVREYLYIDDAISAYLLLAQKQPTSDKQERIFNFGSGKPINVVKLANKIIELSGRHLRVEIEPAVRKGEIKSQYVSWNKAAKLLGWNPKFSLEEGLKKTLCWYADYFRKESFNRQ